MTSVSSDPTCGIAQGQVPLPTSDRRLVVVFASAVAGELAHIAAHVGYQVLLLEPDADRDGPHLPRVGSTAEAALDPLTDVVVTDHHRAELGDVLCDVLQLAPRYIGLMGSPNHPAPHVQPLRERGVAEEDIARVHRPIGLDIGSRTPGEIAVSAVAGLLASRAGRSGGFYDAVAGTA